MVVSWVPWLCRRLDVLASGLLVQYHQILGLSIQTFHKLYTMAEIFKCMYIWEFIRMYVNMRTDNRNMRIDNRNMKTDTINKWRETTGILQWWIWQETTRWQKTTHDHGKQKCKEHREKIDNRKTRRHNRNTTMNNRNLTGGNKNVTTVNHGK